METVNVIVDIMRIIHNVLNVNINVKFAKIKIIAKNALI